VGLMALMPWPDWDNYGDKRKIVTRTASQLMTL
jgi:hypothetical protein